MKEEWQKFEARLYEEMKKHILQHIRDDISPLNVYKKYEAEHGRTVPKLREIFYNAHRDVLMRYDC